MRAEDYEKGLALGESLTRMERYRDSTRGLLVRRIGRRGACMLFFAFLDVVYAYSLFFPPPEQLLTANLRFLDSIAPLWFFAGAWLASGFACLAAAFLKNDWWGFTATITVKTTWGFIYLFAALFGHVDRAYVSATIWLFAAGLLAIISSWPEPEYRSHYRSG